MLGKRQDLPNWGESVHAHVSSFGQSKLPVHSSGLVTTKFRFRDHYVKNLTYTDPIAEDTQIILPEFPVLFLPERGSLGRMSFWASHKSTNSGDIAYFKCKLPEHNPVPITREILRHALEGLAPVHHTQRAVVNRDPLPRVERSVNTAETLERLRNEVSAEYQKIQSDRQNSVNPPPFNADVKIPSPTKEPSKPKVGRRPRNESQYKFKDFEGQHSQNKESGGMQEDTFSAQSQGDLSRSQHQVQGEQTSQPKPQQKLSDKQTGEKKLQQKVPVKSQPAKVLLRTKKSEPQDQNTDARYSSGLRGNSMELEEIMHATREEDKAKEVETIQTTRGRRRKGVKRPNSMEVDPNNFKEKFISHLSDNRIMTRRHIQGLTVVVPELKPMRGKASLLMTPENKVNFDRYRKERIDKMVTAKQVKREQTLTKVQEQQVQKQVRKEVSQMHDELKADKLATLNDLRGSSPNHSTITHSVAIALTPPWIDKPVLTKDYPAQNPVAQPEKTKDIPYIPMTNIEVPVHLRNAWKIEVKPRVRAAVALYQPIKYPIPIAEVPTPNIPSKRSIFDSNSEKYLSVFKTKPFLPDAPPIPVVVPMPALVSVKDEDPLIVPVQNLPTCDPRLALVPTFDYNPLFSDFNPSSERNKLSYQQSYQPYLVQIFQKGAPVCAVEYKFNGEVVHTYDAKVRAMIQQLFDQSVMTSEDSMRIRKMVESVIKFTDTIRNEHPSFEFTGTTEQSTHQASDQLFSSGVMAVSGSVNSIMNASIAPMNQADQEIASKELDLALKHNAFRYVLIRFSLDIELRLQDLTRLNPQEIHMLVAFFNVKFGISEPHGPDRLFQHDPKERILSVANKHIKKVWSRTQNFKKNEEFLKKKWKEFLKFVKSIYKDECGPSLASAKGILSDYPDSNKPQVNRFIYEKFHRHCVLKKMVEYNNDPNQFRKVEWSVIDDIRWPSPDSESADLHNMYSEIEVQFMKIFFSVKAYVSSNLARANPSRISTQSTRPKLCRRDISRTC